MAQEQEIYRLNKKMIKAAGDGLITLSEMAKINHKDLPAYQQIGEIFLIMSDAMCSDDTICTDGSAVWTRHG